MAASAPTRETTSTRLDPKDSGAKGDHQSAQAEALERLEQFIQVCLDQAEGPGSPPRLCAAIKHAVLPGGARIRPRIALSVAMACAGKPRKVAFGGAAAIELLHCASLVHDDLPCFDDADIRRGKPSVHKAFDERLAILAGDALIVMAFEALSLAATDDSDLLARMLPVVAASVGAPCGIAAGQAWECEPHADLSAYHDAKTGALFAAAAELGAIAAGHCDPAGWRKFGERLGLAYQIADDIRDVAGNERDLGKPVGQDDALGRPNAVRALGLPNAVGRLEALLTKAIEEMPKCPGREQLATQIDFETHKLLPSDIWALAS